MNQMALPAASKRKWCVLLTAHATVFQILSGCPAVAGAERILNGSTVNPPHKYPFMVSIWWDGCFIEENDTTTCYFRPEHYCGGSILTKHFILTAAHCCFAFTTHKPTPPQHFRVITGLQDRERLEPWSQNLTILECIIHEDYQ